MFILHASEGVVALSSALPLTLTAAAAVFQCLPSFVRLVVRCVRSFVRSLRSFVRSSVL